MPEKYNAGEACVAITADLTAIGRATSDLSSSFEAAGKDSAKRFSDALDLPGLVSGVASAASNELLKNFDAKNAGKKVGKGFGGSLLKALRAPALASGIGVVLNLALIGVEKGFRAVNERMKTAALRAREIDRAYRNSVENYNLSSGALQTLSRELKAIDEQGTQTKKTFNTLTHEAQTFEEILARLGRQKVKLAFFEDLNERAKQIDIAEAKLKQLQGQLGRAQQNLRVAEDDPFPYATDTYTTQTQRFETEIRKVEARLEALKDLSTIFADTSEQSFSIFSGAIDKAKNSLDEFFTAFDNRVTDKIAEIIGAGPLEDIGRKTSKGQAGEAAKAALEAEKKLNVARITGNNILLQRDADDRKRQSIISSLTNEKIPEAEAKGLADEYIRALQAARATVKADSDRKKIIQDLAQAQRAETDRIAGLVRQAEAIRKANLDPKESFKEALSELNSLESQVGSVFTKDTFSKERVRLLIDAAKATNDVVFARKELARLSQSDEITPVDFRQGLVDLDQALNLSAKREILAQKVLEHEIEIAEAQGNDATVQTLSRQLEQRQRVNDLIELGLTKLDAEKKAAEEIAEKYKALADARQLDLDNRNKDRELDLARLAGTETQIEDLEREVALRERIAELTAFGFSEGQAQQQANVELAEEERARLQGQFRSTFSEGIRAAIDGDFDEFLRSKLASIADGFLDQAINNIADSLFGTVTTQVQNTAANAQTAVAITTSFATGGATAGATISGQFIAAGTAVAAQISAAMQAGGLGLAGAGSGSSQAGSGGGLGGLASLFAGLFADGGTIPRGQFGIVGEAGPELAFAGSAPVSIVPFDPVTPGRRSVADLSGGGRVNNSSVVMNIQTPDARSFRKSQATIESDMALAQRRAARDL